MATKRINGEGSIRKKTVKGKTYWEGRYTDEKGVQRSVSAKTQSEVRDKLKIKQNQVEKEREKQRIEEEGRTYYDKNITLDEWQKIYMDLYTRHLKPQTKALKERTYSKYFQESLGYKTIRSITEEDLIYLQDVMFSKGLTHNYIVSVFSTLGTLFNKAVEKKIIPNNPIKELKLHMGEAKTSKRALTLEELDWFFITIREKFPYLEPLFVFFQNTGCRIGEAVAIEWKDISDDMRACSITKTINTYYDAQKQCTITLEGSPKNNTSKRVIPLNDSLKKMLIDLKKERQQENLYSPNTKVFLSKRKKVLCPIYIDEQLKKISNIIRQKYEPSFPNISSHWFRHTFASYGVEKNIPSIYLQKICGWANGDMLSKIYAHMNDEQALSAVQNIYKNN